MESLLRRLRQMKKARVAKQMEAEPPKANKKVCAPWTISSDGGGSGDGGGDGGRGLGLGGNGFGGGG